MPNTSKITVSSLEQSASRSVGQARGVPATELSLVCTVSPLAPTKPYNSAEKLSSDRLHCSSRPSRERIWKPGPTRCYPPPGGG